MANPQQNPWSGNAQTPPELDEVIRDFKDKFDNFFSKKSGKKTGGKSFKYIFVLILIVWLFSGIYIIDPAERGVVLRFGVFQEATTQGPHWHIPYPIESVYRINVEQIRTIEIGYRNTLSGNKRISGNVSSESLMLTKDENMIDAKFAVQYKINNVSDYLFNFINPDATLRHVLESVIRQVVGQNTMDYVFEERAVVSETIKQKSQLLLNTYKVGLQITTLNMKDAQPPEQVQAAFDDAVKAREDRLRLINEAETYSNGVLPQARGEGARILQNAQAYKAEVVAQSEGEADRFNKIRAEYEKAPVVTKERLYRETVEQVLANSSKVLVDSNANSLMYLPIDKLIEKTNSQTKNTVNNTAANQNNNIKNNNSSNNVRNLFRTREVR